MPQVTHSPPSSDHKKQGHLSSLLSFIPAFFSPLAVQSMCVVINTPPMYQQHAPTSSPQHAVDDHPSLHTPATTPQSRQRCFAKDSYWGFKLLRKFLLKISGDRAVQNGKKLCSVPVSNTGTQARHFQIISAEWEKTGKGVTQELLLCQFLPLKTKITSL